MSMADDRTTVLAALAERLASDPDGPYLDFVGDAYTARRMDAEAGRLATRWRGSASATATGRDPARERAEQVVIFFAALKLGAIQVPINTAYKGEFLRHQLADSGAQVLSCRATSRRAAEVVRGDDRRRSRTASSSIRPTR